MNIKTQLQNDISLIIEEIFGLSLNKSEIIIELTRPEFEGDYTFVVFPLVRLLKSNPQIIAEQIGEKLKHRNARVETFNIIKGFLNIKFQDTHWIDTLVNHIGTGEYGKGKPTGRKVLIEFCSPNTNKPLHLGHIRNILIGWSMAQISEFAGNTVFKTQIINDRGIAICKSMLAWKKYGEGKTPISEKIKSDHFVGQYYVLFENKFREEYKHWQNSDAGYSEFSDRKTENESEEQFFSRYKNEYFNRFSILGGEVKGMLLDWEEGNKEVLALWRRMNAWVYEGFEETYTTLGIHFDKIYYESDTYLLGKKEILKRVEDAILIRKEDGSIWVDLTDEGLDQKILLRSDGTSVYITQDIGTALVREEEIRPDKMVYVVADEQNYHFEVLFKTLKKMGYFDNDKLYHLSYGMVDLPTGRMKSREGTVVDADDLVLEVVNEAKALAEEKTDLTALSASEQSDLFYKVGMSALKYFILKVQPKRKMIFDPSESVDLQGNTGPYIQNAYVRIKSILRKSGDYEHNFGKYAVNSNEVDLIKTLYQFEEAVQEASYDYDPSVIATFAYGLSKKFHKYYHDIPILSDHDQDAKNFRLFLIGIVAEILSKSMNLLGIDMPERM